MKPFVSVRCRAAALPLALLLAACGGTSFSDPSAVDAGGPPSDGSSPSPGMDGSKPLLDAGKGADDGTPSYTSQCTPLSQQNGTSINTTFGRLDGTLAYVVPQGGSSSCNGDFSHVHLQIKANGSIYDVAVDIGKTAGDVLFYEADMAIPASAWSEGWHGTDFVSYPQIGLHAGQFAPEDPATLGKKIEAELATVNHIAVFGKGYPTGNGCHDIHYENGSTDGAIVIDPLSAKAHVLFFHFSTQSF